jgi:hypothetical protein
MEYSFVGIPKEGYLLVQARGDNSPDVIRRYFQEVLELCAAEQWSNVLIDENLKGPRLTVIEVFQVISEKAEAIRSTLRLIAFVDTNPDRSDLNLKFGETVAVNRGLSARVFETLEAAEAWLGAEMRRQKKAKAPPP